MNVATKNALKNSDRMLGIVADAIRSHAGDVAKDAGVAGGSKMLAIRILDDSIKTEAVAGVFVDKLDAVFPQIEGVLAFARHAKKDALAKVVSPFDKAAIIAKAAVEHLASLEGEQDYLPPAVANGWEVLAQILITE